MNYKEKTPKRLILNVDEKIHTKIKILSTLRNMSITQYVLQVVLERVMKDEAVNKE